MATDIKESDAMLSNKLSENEDEEEPDMTITKELRKATKEVHKISDVLVNAKFAFALSDDGVWYDGLLAFYEIYKYFETHLPEELLPKELHRTEAFEKDFAYFYGPNWKENYEPRPSVKRYLTHLEEVRAKSDLLLFAFAFQMYMALMSGGQLLQKKRMIARKMWIGKKEDVQAQEEAEKKASETISDGVEKDLESRPMPLQITICPEGCAATYFPMKISLLKNKLRRILNKKYAEFSDEFREQFIEESRNVFTFNGEVVRSIKGVNRVNLRKIGLVVLFVSTIYIAIKLAWK